MKEEFRFKKKDAFGLMSRLGQFFASLDDGIEYVITIKKARKLRSLDANAYLWVLLGKLAEKRDLPGTTELYRDYIVEVGVRDVFCMKEKAAERFCRIWGRGRLGNIAIKGESKIPGCVTVMAYYGSSTYDTAEMSRLIDLVVQDCKALGIETATPSEQALLLEEWGASDAAG